MMGKSLSALTAMSIAAGLATGALAQTQMDKALADGAQRLSADAIAERLAGKTVTFESAANGARFLVYYDGMNGMLIKKIGTDAVMEGFYAVSAADHVCFGVKGDKPIRLRCVNVLSIDGMLQKFELDGRLRGRVIEEVHGKLM